MNRKPVVYVSSTYDDLKAHRMAVREALDQAQFDVQCMEKYPAFEQRPLVKCLADVSGADVYVVIVAHRYGHRPEIGNPERKSITHLEYEEARRHAGKPCLAFIVDASHAWSPKWMDSNNERPDDARDLRSFIKGLGEEHGLRAFTDPSNLASLVQSALHAWRSQRENALEDGLKTKDLQGSTDSRGLGANGSAPVGSLQPTLCQPLDIGSIHHYSRTVLEVIGRDAEQEQLLAFASDRAGFLWLQLAGVGGQGKSRLGLELWRSLESKDWRCGLLEAETFESFQNQWDHWQPDRPHLLIADYILGREKELKPVIQSLAKRRLPLRFPVRLLLLERQRWDRGSLLPSTGVRAKEHSLNSATEEGRAEWFLKLTTRQGNDPEVMSCRYQAGVIELRALGQEELIALVRKAGEAVGAPVLASDEAIAKQLTQIDPAGRPLYAYFLGQLLGARPFAKLSSNQELLTAVLNKDWAHRWGAAFDGVAPSIGEDIPAMRLAALATILRGVDAAALIRRGLLTQQTGGVSVRKQAMVLTDGPLGGDMRGPGSFITPLEPDLLGEWFVIYAFSLGLPLEDLMSLSWRVDASATALFLERVAQDFSAHPITKELLQFEAGSAEARAALSRKAAGILISLHAARVQYPENIVGAVRTAAQEGDARAMSSLAHCYLTGASVAADEKQAFEWYQRSAVAGDAGGMCNLGVCYLLGTGIPKDEALGLEWLRKGASGGHSRSMLSLGWCHMQGIGVEKDAAEAVRWYRKAIEAGDTEAMQALGLSYEEGTGVDKDVAEAVRWYRKAVAAGDASAIRCLGVMYEHGRGVQRDQAEAVRCYRKAVEAGDIYSFCCLGVCYEKGIGVEKDEAVATHWYRRGSEAGDVTAMRYLGVNYEFGIGVEKNEAEAVRWYRKASELGDVEAMRFLGINHEKGIGVAKDEVEATRWYRKAIEAGDVVAMRYLGMNYTKGIGVEKDGEEAVRWYRKAVDAGDIPARRLLGVCYQYGLGIAKDEAEAVRLYRHAAETGDTTAMRYLGLCLQFGIGLEKDFAESTRWFCAAVELGDQEAKPMLDVSAAQQALARTATPARPRSEAWADAHVGELGSAWTDVPLLPLAWCELSARDEDSRLLLSHIHEAFEMRRELSRLDDAVCEVMRAARLPFYPGCRLVELQLTWPEQAIRASLVVTAVCFEHGAVLLDGNAATIHTINDYRLDLSNSDVVPEYLRFFCVFSRSPKDCPFYLPASIDDIPLAGQVEESLPAEILSADFTIERLQTDAAAEVPEHGYRAFVCYSNGLFRSTFTVRSSGEATMESDEVIVADLPMMRRHFDGPFRTKPLPS